MYCIKYWNSQKTTLVLLYSYMVGIHWHYYQTSHCFKYPKTLTLTLTPKNTFQIFLPNKILESQILTPKKVLWSFLWLEIWITPPELCTLIMMNKNLLAPLLSVLQVLTKEMQQILDWLETHHCLQAEKCSSYVHSQCCCFCAWVCPGDV